MRIARHKVKVWLMNSGWTGGPYGIGQRMAIAHTRAMVRAALDGALDNVATRPDPTFGLAVPVSCPDVPTEVLDPRARWSDPDTYDAQARKLAAMFAANFQAYVDDVSEEVRAAGPRAA